jgi:hypothetical protein
MITTVIIKNKKRRIIICGINYKESGWEKEEEVLTYFIKMKNK